jgi:poly(3-hydroxybutyrate) depolymerase
VALAALRHAGLGADLVAVSQSGWAAVAALRTVAAAAPEVTPRSVVLLGSPIDPLHRPVPLQQMVAALPEPLELSGLLTTVPGTQPGAGRSVFPSLIQLAAVASSAPSTYAEVQLGTLLEHLGWLDRGYREQHRDLHALIDVPGELFTDLVTLHKGRDLELGGAPWSETRPLLAALQPATRLVTVEAAADSLVGPGQTHAAQDLLGTADSVRLTVEGAEHQDLFVGPLFARRVAPALRDFLA